MEEGSFPFCLLALASLTFLGIRVYFFVIPAYIDDQLRCPDSHGLNNYWILVHSLPAIVGLAGPQSISHSNKSLEISSISSVTTENPNTDFFLTFTKDFLTTYWQTSTSLERLKGSGFY